MKRQMYINFFSRISRASFTVFLFLVSISGVYVSGQSEDGAIVLEDTPVVFCSFKIFKTAYGSGTIGLDDDRGRIYDFGYSNCKRAGTSTGSTLVIQGKPAGSFVSPVIKSRYGFLLQVTYATAGEMTLSSGGLSSSGSTGKASSDGKDGTLTLFVPRSEAAFAVGNTSGGSSLVYISNIRISPLTADDVTAVPMVIADRKDNCMYDLSGRSVSGKRRGVLIKGGRKVLVR